MTAGEQQDERRALVAGFGLTGCSVVRYLRTRGFAVEAADSRDLPPGLKETRGEFPGVALHTGGFDEQLFAGYDLIVVSPGVPLSEPVLVEAAARDAEIIGDIELFAREARAPVIAITGSNGKSTVTTLVGLMLEAAGQIAAVGGNIGRPALDLLPAPGSDELTPDYYVLELSSFQLETTRNLQAEAAAVLNISADHMDRYPDLGAYIAAKARILRGAKTAVLNRQDAAVMKLAESVPNCITFGLDTPPGAGDFGLREIQDERWLCRGETRLCRVRDLALAGQQNVANVLAAMALATQAGVALTPETVAAACCFPGLPHRCETVGEWLGVRWINDSKGTNVGATVAAIEGFEAPLVLIAGGQGKGADFGPLRQALEGSARAAVLFGQDAGQIASVLEGAVETHRVESLETALETAAELAKPGDVVLFSPACASFDMFESYARRGDLFRRLVRERAL